MLRSIGSETSVGGATICHISSTWATLLICMSMELITRADERLMGAQQNKLFRRDTVRLDLRKLSDEVDGDAEICCGC